MNLPQWAEGEQVPQDFTALSNLIEQPQYTDTDKKND